MRTYHSTFCQNLCQNNFYLSSSFPPCLEPSVVVKQLPVRPFSCALRGSLRPTGGSWRRPPQPPPHSTARGLNQPRLRALAQSVSTRSAGDSDANHPPLLSHKIMSQKVPRCTAGNYMCAHYMAKICHIFNMIVSIVSSAYFSLLYHHDETTHQ